ncbi:MAG: hypothetical protein AABY22_21860, partial [Nanoarchaeota archaeon]
MFNENNTMGAKSFKSMTSEELRKNILISSWKAGACHLGSSFSCIEIIEAIYEVKKQNDVFIFAKASGVSALYCYLHPVNKACKY